MGAKSLRKTLDIGSNLVYTGCRKRRKVEKRTLGVNEYDTRYCKYYVYWALLFSLRFPFPAVSFLYMREQAYNSLTTVGLANRNARITPVWWSTR